MSDTTKILFGIVFGYCFVAVFCFFNGPINSDSCVEFVLGRLLVFLGALSVDLNKAKF